MWRIADAGRSRSAPGPSPSSSALAIATIARPRLNGSRSAASAPVAERGRRHGVMVFRRDRIACTRGANRLEATKLTQASKTRRMIAGCCATPMYVAFDDKRPWVSALRALFGAMRRRRKCGSAPGSDDRKTRFNDGLPSHPGYPFAMILRVLAAWPGMLFSRPVGALP